MKNLLSTQRVISLTLLAASGCWAQNGSPPSTPLFASKQIITSPITGDERKQMVLISVAIQPNGVVPLHTHPGDCAGTVVEGVVELIVDGQSPRRFTAGETYSNLRGTVHGFRNVGTAPAKLLNSLVVDKDVPAIIPLAPTAK